MNARRAVLDVDAFVVAGLDGVGRMRNEFGGFDYTGGRGRRGRRVRLMPGNGVIALVVLEERGELMVAEATFSGDVPAPAIAAFVHVFLTNA
jgi:hypothetical protein